MEQSNDEVIKYLDKAYAGLIGMIVGVIYGSPLESDYYDRKKIKKYFDLEKRNTFSYSKYASDDDINGPFIFSKSYFENEIEIPTSEQIAETWLQNVLYEKGMFWWGPSTERKAYENLYNGVAAHKSGSKEVNGAFLSNQIGGQIFIDSWGIIFGEDTISAVKSAENAARVSHDENAVEGGKFVTACISLAFSETEIEKIVKKAMFYLDDNFEIKPMVSEFLKLYEQNGTIEQAQELIELYGKGRNWGHVIPNAAVIVYSLLWGENNFERSLNLALQSAWDTDCNASNVGTIIGVLNGIEKIPLDMVELVNDEIILSGAIGSENIMSISSFLEKVINKKYNHFFDTKFFHNCATYGIQLSNKARSKLVVQDDKLTILINGLNKDQSQDVFKKVLYTQSDLQDTRYQPNFSPKIEPGDQILIEADFNLDNIGTRFYVKSLDSEEKKYIDTVIKNKKICIKIPVTKSNIITEFGIEITNNGSKFQQVWGELVITNFEIIKNPNYNLKFQKNNYELDTVVPFVCDRGNIYVKDHFYEHDMQTKVMNYYTFDKLLALTGTLDKYKTGKLTYDVIPKNGDLEIVFYGKDLRNFFLFGYSGNSLIVSKVTRGKRKVLFEQSREIKKSELSLFKIEFKNELTSFYLNDELIVELELESFGSLHGIYLEKPGDGAVVEVSLELGENCD